MKISTKKSSAPPPNFLASRFSELDCSRLAQLGRHTLEQLETPDGIMASDRSERYGCIFGRDSLITSLKLLCVYRFSPDTYYLSLVKKILIHLALLQGTKKNPGSGEEPGKCIHEFRRENHEHLTKKLSDPWYEYPDGTMRNYDSVDATPLFLITVHQYFEVTQDTDFLAALQNNIAAALHWLVDYGDSNREGLIDYRIPDGRKSGGLAAQSWMDSPETLFYEESDEPVAYPIAPVEVQAYAFAAFGLWAETLKKRNWPNAPSPNILFSAKARLRQRFHGAFVIQSEGSPVIAAAVDGHGRPLLSTRSCLGHLLWASFLSKEKQRFESILEESLIPSLVQRLMAEDLFEPAAGIRTLSRFSRKFQAMSYHNGSIWPHDTSLIIEGLENFGYYHEAQKVREAILMAWHYFQTPLELFAFEKGRYLSYLSPTGQQACQKQAWSAACLVAEALAYQRS